MSELIGEALSELIEIAKLLHEAQECIEGANKAIEGLTKLNPSPLATASVVKQIVAANYDEHLHLLEDCDLVIEAISERMDWKKSLFEKVAPHIGAEAIFASRFLRSRGAV